MSVVDTRGRRRSNNLCGEHVLQLGHGLRVLRDVPPKQWACQMYRLKSRVGRVMPAGFCSFSFRAL